MVKYAASRSKSKQLTYSGQRRRDEYGSKQFNVWMWITSMVPA